MLYIKFRRLKKWVLYTLYISTRFRRSWNFFRSWKSDFSRCIYLKYRHSESPPNQVDAITCILFSVFRFKFTFSNLTTLFCTSPTENLYIPIATPMPHFRPPTWILSPNASRHSHRNDFSLCTWLSSYLSCFPRLPLTNGFHLVTMIRTTVTAERDDGEEGGLKSWFRTLTLILKRRTGIELSYLE